MVAGRTGVSRDGGLQVETRPVIPELVLMASPIYVYASGGDSGIVALHSAYTIGLPSQILRYYISSYLILDERIFPCVEYNPTIKPNSNSQISNA